MPYVFLGIAIVSELIGTTSLQYSEGFTKAGPSVCSVLAYTVSCFFLSKCLQHINLSIAYASWCALGILVTTLISVYVFKKGITAAGVAGLILIVAGVAILNLYGTPKM